MVADAPTLDALLERWDRFLWRTVCRYARHLRLDPEELRAETLLVVVRRFGRFDPHRERSSFAAWLNLIVRSEANHLRDRQERRCEVRIEPREDDDPVAVLVPDPHAPDPAAVAMLSELREAVAAAVSDLSAAERAAVRKRFFDGESLAPHDRGRLEEALVKLRARFTGSELTNRS